ncbi:alkaline phosphatase family protein [Pontibacter sp. BT731]|uniref:alkaline phosphatase family protein n=1 Tax=Pontibacter coccineus TaxID=3063328 RepID=UPI0026E1E77C|nr:alkaline phosphatase family protein [Pontibacter sp. BT731]MDO6389192.1 alkaline phosphatase family protein [Pontibacter sp. BT731]
MVALREFLKQQQAGWQQMMLILSVAALLSSCAASGAGGGAGGLRSENVIILVIDGVRYSETWGAVPGLIPNMSQKMVPQGTFCNNFRNEGYTYTNSGHTAITTGINQAIDNTGAELPANPSFFQVWRKQTGKPATAAWIVSSKDKLDILGNTLNPDWQGHELPSLNCGISGPGSGYRADSLTLIEVLKVLKTNRPNLMLINFMEPDGFAHAGNWEFYLRGIARGDRYAKQLWDFLRKDKHYRKKTTLLITTDHGRHLDSVDGGWVDHGDDCEGCRRISLLALGPDFRKGGFVETKYTLVDISATVAPMLGIAFPQSEGTVMTELFTRRSLRRLPAGKVPVP